MARGQEGDGVRVALTPDELHRLFARGHVEHDEAGNGVVTAQGDCRQRQRAALRRLAAHQASPASTHRTRFAQLVLTALPSTCGWSAAPAAGGVEALLEELDQGEIRHHERDQHGEE